MRLLGWMAPQPPLIVMFMYTFSIGCPPSYIDDPHDAMGHLPLFLLLVTVDKGIKEVDLSNRQFQLYGPENKTD